MATITFNPCIPQTLRDYIDQFIVPNHNNEITGEQHNNVETGLLDLILATPQNYNRAAVTSSAGLFTATCNQSILIFNSGATGAIQLTSNRWNEWVIFNGSGATKQFTGDIATYKTINGTTRNYITNGDIVHLAKGNDNIWYRVNNEKGSGGSGNTSGTITDTITTEGSTYSNADLLGVNAPYLFLDKQFYSIIDGDYTFDNSTEDIVFTSITVYPDSTIVIPYTTT